MSEVVIAPPEIDIRLDLGAGENVRQGFEGVDLFAPNTKHRQNLFTFPWKWEDSSVTELHCSHFIEHIPMVYIDPNNHVAPIPINENYMDLFFKFFDECYRILKPNGVMTVICPTARSNRAFQDPTHRRFIVVETFHYLVKEFRDVNKLSHYTCKCNFGINVEGIGIQIDEMARHAEVQARRFNECWNVIPDWKATLKAIK